VSRSEIKKVIEERKLSMLVVSYVDLVGITRAKPKASSEIDSLFDSGVKTGRRIYARNAVEKMMPRSATSMAEGDIAVVPDADTFAVPSFAPDIGRFLGDLHEKDGSVSSLCARGFYKRVLADAKSKGLRAVVGFESEFHLLLKECEGVTPAFQSQNHSLIGYEQHRALFADIFTALRSMGMQPLKAHIEGRNGQLEIDMASTEALKAADSFVYFKEAVRNVAAAQHGSLASFMPKVGPDMAGSGFHLHMSLWNPEGVNVFHDKKDKRGLGLSDTCYHFIGGVLAHTKALCAISSPIVNSYKRLLPGRVAVDALMYGPGNRGAAVRIPDERGDATRIECRFPDNACNPYLAMGCILAAGLEGIEKRIDPGDPITFETHFMGDRELRAKGLELMPRSLGESLEAFGKDKLMRETLGDELFEEYIVTKESEIAEAADKVTQWEIENFLDVF
jgi:glutamine synthetase